VTSALAYRRLADLSREAERQAGIDADVAFLDEVAAFWRRQENRVLVCDFASEVTAGLRRREHGVLADELMSRLGTTLATIAQAPPGRTNR
jgi:hypothetical protein